MSTSATIVLHDDEEPRTYHQTHDGDPAHLGPLLLQATDLGKVPERWEPVGEAEPYWNWKYDIHAGVYTVTDQHDGQQLQGDRTAFTRYVNRQRERVTGRIVLLNIGRGEGEKYKRLPKIDEDGHETGDLCRPRYEHDVYAALSTPDTLERTAVTRDPVVSIGEPHGGFAKTWAKILWHEQTLKVSDTQKVPVSESTLVSLRAEYESMKRNRSSADYTQAPVANR